MQSRPKLPPHFIKCGGLKTLKPSPTPIKQGTCSSTFCEMWKISAVLSTLTFHEMWFRYLVFRSNPPTPPNPLFMKSGSNPRPHFIKYGPNSAAVFKHKKPPFRTPKKGVFHPPKRGFFGGQKGGFLTAAKSVLRRDARHGANLPRKGKKKHETHKCRKARQGQEKEVGKTLF